MVGRGDAAGSAFLVESATHVPVAFGDEGTGLMDAEAEIGLFGTHEGAALLDPWVATAQKNVTGVWMVGEECATGLDGTSTRAGET